MDLGLIISLISGAVGGNVAAGLMKNARLDTELNSVVAVLGGGLGSIILGMLDMGGAVAAAGVAGGMDITSIIGEVAGGGRREARGGVGGGVLLAVIGIIKSAIAA